jgi:hypothetical protein
MRRVDGRFDDLSDGSGRATVARGVSLRLNARDDLCSDGKNEILHRSKNYTGPTPFTELLSPFGEPVRIVQ